MGRSKAKPHRADDRESRVQKLTERQRSKRVRPKHTPHGKILDDIKHYQATTKLLIPKLSFQNLVRGVMHGLQEARGANASAARIESQALLALQEAAEVFLVGVFEDSYILAVHCKRVTLMLPDMRLAVRIRAPPVL
eukprot:NODE_21848_length_734_cov_3.082372.p1 GENE.NODE_21848_length_734_cov_3.082372~~NODE_21848_length_734_cov_3.082372.p1  ORF type:complete len:150 (+),score=42.96 NODE_21848_length_734_cov_3.082372:41-451(+)